MIKRSDEMTFTVRHEMLGGSGDVVVTDIFNRGEYSGHTRLVATIRLEPGCSIGKHLHKDEEEIFFVIDGELTYNDNGKTEILSKGDACICKSGQEHAVMNNSNKTVLLHAVILTY